MRIAVGVVHHGEGGRAPVDESAGLELLTRTNARAGARGTPWLGFGANHNHMIDAAANADWYVALNPDVEATASEIRGLVEQAEEQEYSVVAPLFRAPWGITGGPQPAVPGARRWLREAITGSTRGAPSNARVVASEWVSGACIAIRVKKLPIRFDERYFMYFEDVDLCCRAREAGGKVGVCTNIVLRHRSGWSSSDPLLFPRGIEFARSAIEFARQRQQSPQLMRLAGLIRFSSRLAIPGLTAAERASAHAVTSAFLPFAGQEGLAELARRHNELLT